VSTASSNRALIVDDDENVRLSLARIMQKAGYLVAFVSNARDAIAEICAAAPDIVVADVFMQGAGGFELINWLRRRKSAIPIIAMSGVRGTLTGQLGLAAKLGAKATVLKPFQERDVLEAIKAALGDAKSPWPSRRWS
jgi:CheY-like chemotaxis protein